jgi:hypothetical protein
VIRSSVSAAHTGFATTQSPRTVSPVGIRREFDGADDALLHLEASGVLIVRGQGGEDAPVVGVPSSSATLNGAGHPTSHQEVRQSHMPAGVATFRGWVMSRMAWWKIVREGARRVLAEALAAEVDVYIAATPVSATSMSGGWWCARAPISLGRC